MQAQLKGSLDSQAMNTPGRRRSVCALEILAHEEHSLN